MPREGAEMFGRSFFGARFWAPHYFGDGGDVVSGGGTLMMADIRVQSAQYRH
jgi:hypothetical protein